ncbi:glycosyltransferase [Mycoplasmopsis ciconiae]|uniref:Glycosyltransferase n=1 Tax=Mycoplasmopsis ciconiae TaxID=561067 RepID=A0ABU7MMF9_9BACT|nr:glycosyltransferase [Mycoplasmopsis ciconiae]
MKLSIISSVTEYARDVRSFLNDLKDQDNQDFEIILTLNKSSNNKKTISVISEFSNFFGSRLKIIYNSKRQSQQFNIISAFRICKGDYVTIINSDTSLRKYYISRMGEVASRYDVDILEFKPRFVGSIRWKPKARINLSEPVKIANNPEVIAYSFPFIFNKIFKKSLVKKLEKHKTSSSSTDNKFAIELNYLLLLNAKKYMYYDQRLKREYFDLETWLNPQGFLTSFNAIDPVFKLHSQKVTYEFDYLRAYFMKLFLPGLLKGTFVFNKQYIFNHKILEQRRGEKIISKLDDIIKKVETTEAFKIFKETNIYMLKDNKETSLIKKRLDVSEWDDILQELE